MNKKSYANHVRWCIKNPRHDEILQGMREKLQHTTKQDYDVVCEVCGNPYIVNCTSHIYEIGKYKKTCSDKCAKKLTAIHTDNQERINSIKISMEKYKKPIYKKTCICCNKDFNTYDINQEYCSYKCQRISQGNINIKDCYKRQCAFKFALNDYPEEFDFQLINEYGWYSAANRGNNLNGVSRDHMFSCDEGMHQLIDPYLISHPANCVLMQHNQNASKRNKCSITFEQLKDRVKKWNEKYGTYTNMIDYSYFMPYNIKFQK